MGDLKKQLDIGDIADMKTGIVIEEDNVLSVAKWLKTAERSNGKIMNVPNSLSNFLTRLFDENDVKAPSWYFTSDWQSLVVTGYGVNKIKEEVKQAVHNNEFDLGFKIEFVDSDVVTKPLSGIVVAQLNDDVQLREGACELTLHVQNPEQRGIALSTAHMFMTPEENNHLDTGRLAVIGIQQTLEVIGARFQTGSLMGHLRQDSAVQVGLNIQPRLGYRTHRHNLKEFMNDIALLEVPMEALEQFQRVGPMVRNCRFNGIFPIRTEIEVNEMVGTIVMYRGRRAEIISARCSPPDWRLGHHLAFELIEGETRLNPGSSGSVVYVEDGMGQKFAAAMLKGVRPGTEGQIRPSYEAIIIQPALDEMLGQDNLIRVVPLRPTQAEEQ